MKISKSLKSLVQDFNNSNDASVFLVADLQSIDDVDYPCVFIGEDDSDQSVVYVDQGDGFSLYSASDRFLGELPENIANGRDLRKALVEALNNWEI